ncbi:hypothetical protein QF001_007197 [Paraburkholderia youngii]
MSSRVAAPTRCRIGEARVRGPSNPLTVNVVQFRCVCQPAVALCVEADDLKGSSPLVLVRGPSEPRTGSLDLYDQHAARPAVPERFGGLPVPTRDIFDLVEQGAKVEPRQLCSGLLHKFRIRPCLGKRAPLVQVAKRSSLRGPKRTPRSVTDHRSDRGRTASSSAGPYCANIVGQRPLRFHRQEAAPETERPQQPVVQCGDTGLRTSHGHVEQPKL